MYSKPRRPRYYGGRKSSKRSTLTSKIRRKANKRYNWVPSLDSPCGTSILPFHACVGSAFSPNQTGVVVIDGATGLPSAVGPAVAFHLFAPDDPDPTDQSLARRDVDDVTIRRIVGYIDFIPQHFAGWRANSEEPEPNCQTVKQIRPLTNYFFRAGLKKDDWILNVAGDAYSAPTRDPMETMQWCDGRFLKMWQRDVVSSVSYDVQQGCADDFIAICPNVNGGANNIVPPITDADQSTYVINTEIETTCVELQGSDFANASRLPYIQRSNGAADRPFRINLSSRRPIRLRESQGLTLWFNWTAVDYLDAIAPNTGSHSPAVRFLVRPHVKLLLET